MSKRDDLIKKAANYLTEHFPQTVANPSETTPILGLPFVMADFAIEHTRQENARLREALEVIVKLPGNDHDGTGYATARAIAQNALSTGKENENGRD